MNIRRGNFCEGLARADEARCQRGSAVTNERKRELERHEKEKRRGKKKQPTLWYFGGFFEDTRGLSDPLPRPTAPTPPRVYGSFFFFSCCLFQR